MSEREIVERDIEASRLLRMRLGVVLTNELTVDFSAPDEQETPDELPDPLNDPEIAEAEYPAPFEEGDETPDELDAVKVATWEIKVRNS